MILATVKSSDALTSKETTLSFKAREFIRKVGYPLQRGVLNVVQDGNVNNMTHEAKDIRHAFVLG